MKKLLLLSMGTVLASMLWQCQSPSPQFNYPMTQKTDITDTYYGQTVADPYRWLEDDQSEATAEWVKQQNAVTFGYIDSIPFRTKIKERLTQIWNYPKSFAPWKEGNHYFFAKNNGLQNQNVYFRVANLGDAPTEVLNPNTLSDDGTVSLTNFSVSPDGNYLGYGISRGGSDWNEFFVRDLNTLEDLTDHLKWIKFSDIAWHKNGFFYNRYPQPKEGDELKGTNEQSKIYYHKLGDAQEKDQLIYEDPEHPHWSFSASVTDDQKMMIIYVTESTSGNALYFKPLESNQPITKVVENFESNYSVVDHHENWLYVLTNNDAPRYQLIRIPVDKPGRENWETVIAESESDVLSEVTILNNQFIANYMHNAYTVIKTFDLQGQYLSDIELPALGSAWGFNGKRSDTETFYTFSSFTYPAVVYRYNAATKKSEVHSTAAIEFDFSDYETKQIFYTSTDGTSIPMFLVAKKGIKLDGSNPVWLYGYGGFNVSLNPGFSIGRLPWLENGGIYAIANLRGGGEFGEKWHKDGTLYKKQNVFDDFISAAKYLIEQGYTQADKMVIQGGSNGGLLIGAVINQAPQLFKVALPAVGVMDMLRYHKFTIGRFWATDYGTADDSLEMFNYLKAYSPLHNIKKGLPYPAVLVTTADHDDRVVPAHSFKYIATLQEAYQGDNPVMIRIETQAGHGAGKPTSKQIDELTDLYSFTFDQLGIQPYSETNP